MTEYFINSTFNTTNVPLVTIAVDTRTVLFHIFKDSGGNSKIQSMSLKTLKNPKIGFTIDPTLTVGEYGTKLSNAGWSIDNSGPSYLIMNYTGRDMARLRDNSFVTYFTYTNDGSVGTEDLEFILQWTEQDGTVQAKSYHITHNYS